MTVTFNFDLKISSVLVLFFVFDMLVSETGFPFMAQAGLEPLSQPLLVLRLKLWTTMPKQHSVFNSVLIGSDPCLGSALGNYFSPSSP